MREPYLLLTDKAGTPLLSLMGVDSTPTHLEAECYCLLTTPKKGTRTLYNGKKKFKRPVLKIVGLVQWKPLKVEKQ